MKNLEYYKRRNEKNEMWERSFLTWISYGVNSNLLASNVE